MQGSEQWHANNINGQVVHTKPPYPGVGRCSVPMIPCSSPVPVSDVRTRSAVVPSRDAMLMEFEEDSAGFFFESGSGEGVGSFPVVQWASSVAGSYVPGSPLGEGDEAVVKPSHVGACDVVPPLVVWEELFTASEAYFADGLSSMGVVQEGKGEGGDSGRVVESGGVSAVGERGSVWLGRLSAVLWVFATCVGCLVVLGFACWLFSLLFLLVGGERRF